VQAIRAGAPLSHPKRIPHHARGIVAQQVLATLFVKVDVFHEHLVVVRLREPILAVVAFVRPAWIFRWWVILGLVRGVMTGANINGILHYVQLRAIGIMVAVARAIRCRTVRIAPQVPAGTSRRLDEEALDTHYRVTTPLQVLY
jgi:hypothetical protein